MSTEDRSAKLAEKFIEYCKITNVDPVDFEVALCLMAAAAYLSTENKERFSGAIKAAVQDKTIH